MFNVHKIPLGLIVRLDDNTMLSRHWATISARVKCAFVYNNDEQREAVESYVSEDSVFVFQKKSFFVFGMSRVINESLDQLGLNIGDVAYVTSSPTDAKSIIDQMCIGTIYVGSDEIDYAGMGGYVPDYILETVKSIETILDGENLGYYSEVITTFAQNKWLGDSGNCFQFELATEELDVLVISGGRFFDYAHPRRPFHQLSNRIWKSKTEPSQDFLFIEILGGLVGHVQSNIEAVTGITRVPPRPGKRDRLRPVVGEVCTTTQLNDFTDALVCRENYPSQKGLNKEARALNVRGKFDCNEDLSGMHIVLVDDVFTTGATTLECASELYRAGADRVTILVYAVNQFDPAFYSQKHLECDRCDGTLVMRFQNKVKPFYGCTNYVNGCRGSLQHANGLARLLEPDEDDSGEVDEFDLNF